ncbi:MAG: hypothetical protein R3C56_11865 [Pirellulaceae bacterium]
MTTSQIDMQSEQLIRESLADHRGERTMIIITHREKLLELADVVYEVVEGRLVERPHPGGQGGVRLLAVVDEVTSRHSLSME